MGYSGFVFVFLILSTPFFVIANDEIEQLECLRVSKGRFLLAVKLVIKEMEKAVAFVSRFLHKFHNFRMHTAINDCLDLLEFSLDELSLIVSAAESPHVKDTRSTGDRASDLQTWLSATLGNQETCLDGFDGTKGLVKKIIQRSLRKVTIMIADVLGMVISSDKSAQSEKKSKAQRDYPAWMKDNERGLLQDSANHIKPDVVVAKDGSGNFSTIMEALNFMPNSSTTRFVIHIKKGVYNEYVDVNKKKWNLMIIGDGMNQTVITGNHSYADGWTTYRSATFAVSGQGFIARDLTFENTAGPDKHQAVALRSDSDLSAFYRCGFYGYQDTLYAHTLRQFYRECRISGTVDFIFGYGAVVFQDCDIIVRKPSPGQKNTVTAQGNKYEDQNSGFTIQFSNITAEPELKAVANTTYSYLGRPWKEYSRTVIMQSYICESIRPEGWLEWDGNFALDTLYYGEFMNYGPGSSLNKRVKWKGYHLLNQSSDASKFTVEQLIRGDLWLPFTGVTYNAGLGK